VCLHGFFLNLHVTPSLKVPEVHCVPTNTNLRLLQGCAMLKEPYQPPLLWGWSGHVQTLLFSVFGRFGLPHRSATTHKEVNHIITLLLTVCRLAEILDRHP